MIERADKELFLILGGDVAAGLPSWREPERVLALATLAVAKRRGTPEHLWTRAPQPARGGAGAVLPDAPDRISSTLVRRRVRAGQPIRYFVPDAVATYIDQHRLYGGPTTR